MDLDNVAFSPDTQGMVAGLVALQQANGVDFDTAVARVRATAEATPLFAAVTWDALVDLLRWFATPPSSVPPPAG